MTLRAQAFESPKDYYDRMVDIGVALREYHQDWFQPRELSRIEKECFFTRLRDQSKYLVSQMKDKKEYGSVDMLKELRENDEARYPVNIAHRPGKMDGYDQNVGHPDQKRGGYIARVANVEPYPDTHPDVSLGQLPFGKDPEEAYDEGYYIGVVNTADEMSQHLHLFYNTPSAYWNEDARMRWLYPAYIGTAILDGRLTTILVDSGACMNCVTLEFMKVRGLVAGSIQDLNNHSGCIPINGAGGKRTEPLGYVMMRVQIPQVPS